jgi:hypothetical protein
VYPGYPARNSWDTRLLPSRLRLRIFTLNHHQRLTSHLGSIIQHWTLEATRPQVIPQGIKSAAFTHIPANHDFHSLSAGNYDGITFFSPVYRYSERDGLINISQGSIMPTGKMKQWMTCQCFISRRNGSADDSSDTASPDDTTGDGSCGLNQSLSAHNHNGILFFLLSYLQLNELIKISQSSAHLKQTLDFSLSPYLHDHGSARSSPALNLRISSPSISHDSL